MTPEQRAFAETSITRAVARFLDYVTLAKPLAEMGEDAVLKVRVNFTSDPNLLYKAESRDELGKYLEIQFTTEHTETAE